MMRPQEIEYFQRYIGESELYFHGTKDVQMFSGPVLYQTQELQHRGWVLRRSDTRNHRLHITILPQAWTLGLLE